MIVKSKEFKEYLSNGVVICIGQDNEFYYTSIFKSRSDLGEDIIELVIPDLVPDKLKNAMKEFYFETKITLKNIKSYIEGNTQMILDGFGLQPLYIQEQIAYRMLQCKNDCMIQKKCKYCGCNVPAKLYVKESCNNGIRFPDLMDEIHWNNFKEKNGIR